MKKKTKDICKNRELFLILQANFGKSLNLARIKFLSLFICALCKVQTVGFEKIATGFDTISDTGSSLRRIQRFFASYVLDLDIIARLIVSMLPNQAPYVISMDRTNWKFGSNDINALVVAITYKGVAFPIIFSLLDKRGNSNTSERIALMDRFIRLFGEHSINCLVADREFVGDDWVGYLNNNKIRYYLRIRNNFWITDPRNGKKIKASWLFCNVKINENKVLHKIYRLNNQLVYLSGAKIKNKEGKPELQIIISFNHPSQSKDRYKERWQIETAFKALKTSGFNIEDTHLTQIPRLEKLFAIVIVAFTWAYIVGIYLHEHGKPIRNLNNNRRAKSFFKHGLTYIATVFLNPQMTDNMRL